MYDYNRFLKNIAGAVITILTFFFVVVPLLISSSLPFWLISGLILSTAFGTAFLINYFISKDKNK